MGSYAQTTGTNKNASGGMFANIPAEDDLSTKIVGFDVYNEAKQDIGTIKDIPSMGTG